MSDVYGFGQAVDRWNDCILYHLYDLLEWRSLFRASREGEITTTYYLPDQAFARFHEGPRGAEDITRATADLCAWARRFDLPAAEVRKVARWLARWGDDPFAASVSLPPTTEIETLAQSIITELRGLVYRYAEAEENTKLALDGPEPQAGEQPEYVFRREGDMWHVRAFGVEGHFKASRGFECLGRLLAKPGASIPLEYLVAKDSGAALKFSVPGQVAETVIDKEALREYRDNIKGYDALINQALRDGREGDAEQLRAEREHLIDHIAEVTGLGGKLRHNKTESKKLRDRVQKALKRTYEALRQASPPMSELADHLEAFIQPTEDGYIYMPTPPIDWRTQF